MKMGVVLANMARFKCHVLFPKVQEGYLTAFYFIEHHQCTIQESPFQNSINCQSVLFSNNF